MPLTPDAVCRKYAKKKIKITIRPLAKDDDTLLIEGEREGLEFLGRLFLAQARSEDCGFQIGCDRAGKSFFTKISTGGLYIHRLYRAPKAGRNNSRAHRSKGARRESAPAT
jgi:hypothetical protein